jgi:hypothetical protein
LRPGAGPYAFKGIQLIPKYFGKKVYTCSVYVYDVLEKDGNEDK